MQDAEDALQETLLAAWRGLAGFEERASVRSWLYRIATNRCLNARRAARRRLRRARAALAAERAERPPAGRPDDATERELARRFATAFEADDVEAVVALLTDDAWLTMPPAPHRYRGPDAIAAFCAAARDGVRTAGSGWYRRGRTPSPRSACTCPTAAPTAMVRRPPA